MKKTIICVGCSWTYGHGLPPDQAYPAHLQNLLKDYTVINAGHCGSDINYAIFSAVRLIEEYNPSLVIFQLTTFDRITLGTDGFNNFMSDKFYDDRDDEVYIEDPKNIYKRVIGISDNSKTKITHGSYIANKKIRLEELHHSGIKNASLEEYSKFVSIIVENILHSNYTNQRIYNDLFLFQKYLELKKINLKYFQWIDTKQNFNNSFNRRLFDSSKLINELFTIWLKRNYPSKNFYIDNGYHLSNEGNKILAEELVKYAKKHDLPICIHEKAYKPGVEYCDGSYSLLIGHYCKELGFEPVYVDPLTGDNVESIKGVILLAHNSNITYKNQSNTNQQLFTVK